MKLRLKRMIIKSSFYYSMTTFSILFFLYYLANNAIDVKSIVISLVILFGCLTIVVVFSNLVILFYLRELIYLIEIQKYDEVETELYFLKTTAAGRRHYCEMYTYFCAHAKTVQEFLDSYSKIRKHQFKWLYISNVQKAICFIHSLLIIEDKPKQIARNENEVSETEKVLLEYERFKLTDFQFIPQRYKFLLQYFVDVVKEGNSVIEIEFYFPNDSYVIDSKYIIENKFK